MPRLISAPSRIEAAGTKPKIIDEYGGRVNTETPSVSIAHMRSPGGWTEPAQRPDFHEYTIVLKGMMRVEHDVPPARAILFDLGLISFHFDASGRGFSFQHGEPLDMRFDTTDEDRETASDVIARRSAKERMNLFLNYGEERFASRIARTLVAQRIRQPIRTTSAIERAAWPRRSVRTGTGPAFAGRRGPACAAPVRSCRLDGGPAVLGQSAAGPGR